MSCDTAAAAEIAEAANEFSQSFKWLNGKKGYETPVFDATRADEEFVDMSFGLTSGSLDEEVEAVSEFFFLNK